MKRASVALSALLLLSIPSQSSAAQAKSLSPEAQKLKNALRDLQEKPKDSRVRERYILAFPHDYKGFLELFDLDRELYDGYEYIEVLPGLATTHETQVGKLLVALGRDAHYEADAPGYLQHAIAAYGSQHTKTFADLVNNLPVQKQKQLITFLADVENPATYSEYRSIVDNLKVLGRDRLARKFEIARERRANQPHY